MEPDLIARIHKQLCFVFFCFFTVWFKCCQKKIKHQKILKKKTHRLYIWESKWHAELNSSQKIIAVHVSRLFTKQKFPFKLKWNINQLDLESCLLNHHQSDTEHLTSEVFKESVFPGWRWGRRVSNTVQTEKPPEASRSVIFWLYKQNWLDLTWCLPLFLSKLHCCVYISSHCKIFFFAHTRSHDNDISLSQSQIGFCIIDNALQIM